MRRGDWAWLAVAVGVAAYEAAAAIHPEGELLSQAMDRYRRRHPVVVHVGVIYLAAHLLRRWPPRWDPLHRLAR